MTLQRPLDRMGTHKETFVNLVVEFRNLLKTGVGGQT